MALEAVLVGMFASNIYILSTNESRSWRERLSRHGRRKIKGRGSSRPKNDFAGCVAKRGSFSARQTSRRVKDCE